MADVWSSSKDGGTTGVSITDTPAVAINGTQVVGAQQSAIAAFAITYSSNDPSITPDSALTISNGSSISAAETVEAIEELNGKINAILSALRTHGLIDT